MRLFRNKGANTHNNRGGSLPNFGDSGNWPTNSRTYGTDRTPTVVINNGGQQQPQQGQPRVVRVARGDTKRSLMDRVRDHKVLTSFVGVVAVLGLNTLNNNYNDYKGQMGTEQAVTATVASYITDELGPQIVDIMPGDFSIGQEEDDNEVIGTLTTAEAAATAAEELPKLDLGIVPVMQTEGPTEGITFFSFENEEVKIPGYFNALVTSEQAKITAEIIKLNTEVNKQDPKHLIVEVEAAIDALFDGIQVYDINPSEQVKNLEAAQQVDNDGEPFSARKQFTLSPKVIKQIINSLNDAIDKDALTTLAFQQHYRKLLALAQQHPDYYTNISLAIEGAVRKAAAEVSGLAPSNIRIEVSFADPDERDTPKLPPQLSTMPGASQHSGFNLTKAA